MKIKSSQIQYGVVQEIVAQGRQSDGYRGQGWFLLKRYPEEIYRDEFRGYPMSRLTQKGSGNGKVNDDEWDGEMRKQSAHLPTRLELFHWAPPSKKTVRVALCSLLCCMCSQCARYATNVCRVKRTFQSRVESTLRRNHRAHFISGTTKNSAGNLILLYKYSVPRKKRLLCLV